jgi:hypothetical protein
MNLEDKKAQTKGLTDFLGYTTETFFKNEFKGKNIPLGYAMEVVTGAFFSTLTSILFTLTEDVPEARQDVNLFLEQMRDFLRKSIFNAEMVRYDRIN